ncbi:MAG: metal-dependent hydrolase [Thermoproteales archaeon]|nr:metal-dependent hydrolase [Thermoproteales archaeon]RLE66732.1 MAG: hypothetical protein DRJ47_01825 [Thermoprotei archaeon]
MNRNGHIGLTLLITSAILYFFNLKDSTSLLTALFIVILSTLPDVDLKWEIPHRRYTHNISAGLVAGVCFGFITMYAGIGFIPGFIGGLGGVLCHLLGDLLTYMPFNPLWPFYSLEVSLRLFKSSSKTVNNLFLAAGFTVFTYYLTTIYYGIEVSIP